MVPQRCETDHDYTLYFEPQLLKLKKKHLKIKQLFYINLHFLSQEPFAHLLVFT